MDWPLWIFLLYQFEIVFPIPKVCWIDFRFRLCILRTGCFYNTMPVSDKQVEIKILIYFFNTGLIRLWRLIGKLCVSKKSQSNENFFSAISNSISFSEGEYYSSPVHNLIRYKIIQIRNLVIESLEDKITHI